MATLKMICGGIEAFLIAAAIIGAVLAVNVWLFKHLPGMVHKWFYGK